MITRIYINNFRSFVNFEYQPTGPKQLLLGPNGSGKSSLLDAVVLIREMAVRGASLEDLPEFVPTRWLRRTDVTFELDAQFRDIGFHYRIVWENASLPARYRVAHESVSADGKTLFQANHGRVDLFGANAEPTASYPSDPRRSAFSSAALANPSGPLALLHDWLDRIAVFRMNPFAMKSRAEQDSRPDTALTNFAGWYRHLLLTQPETQTAFLADLRAALPGLTSLRFESVLRDPATLMVAFSQNQQELEYGFHEVSEGQRCLIALYTVLHFVLARGGTVFLDEPENFIGLGELQPWLMAAGDAVDEHDGQIFIVSHHPEFLNQWAPDYGIWFSRPKAGPVQVRPFQAAPDEVLTVAELVARGWDEE